MRGMVALVLMAALGAAGCEGISEAVGWDEARKDLSGRTTKPGAECFPDEANKAEKIVVETFALDLAASPPVVKMRLRNEARDDDFSADVEFGYPAPAGGVAEYIPDFVGVDLPDFKKGEKRDLTVKAPSGHADPPQFAKVLFMSGKDVRMTVARENVQGGIARRGSMFVDERVEVVKVEYALEAAKPVLKFTLMNVDEGNPHADVGELRWKLEFYGKDGNPLPLGKRYYTWRSAEKPLKGFSDKVEIVADRPEGYEYVGSRPVLRVVAAAK